MPGDMRDRGGLEPAGIVHQLEGQALAGRHLQCQRVVDPVDGPDHVHAKRMAGHLRGKFGRIILERHDAVEQRRAGRHLAPALHLGERCMLMLQQLGLACLDVAQPVRDRLCRRDCDAQRQRVDEQPDRALRFGEFGGPARHSDAEHHVVAAAIAGEQQRPGALHQGVDGEPMPPRKRGNIAKC